MNRSAMFATSCVIGCFLTFGAFNAAAQQAKSEEKIEAPVPPVSKEDELEAEIAKLEAEIGKRLDAFDLSPQPLPEIPDNPPPHEGAMIDMPEYRIEPPDLVLIEVLEALPGRPISGERLVRPDGKITLGFYGEVHVRGLTIKQTRVKIIKQLRKVLTDEVLGLRSYYPAPPEDDPELPPIPPVKDEGPFKKPQENLDQQEKPQEKPKAVSSPAGTAPARRRVRAVSDEKQKSPSEPRRPSNAPSLYFGRRLQPLTPEEPANEEPPKAAEASAKPIEVPLQQDDADITIRINVKKGSQTSSVKEEPKAGASDDEFGHEWAIPPDKADRVFVDVTAYNSKNYFVLGDVAAPGKLPITGNDTVLDALQYAGGLLATAEPKDIRLVRPGRDGKPGKVYQVDLDAIQNRGETATNYQIFPNDRIIVGRSEVVKKTIQMDRLSRAIESVVSSVSQESALVRSVKLAAPDQPDVMIKNLVEFWIKEMNRPEGATFNEETLREILLRSLPVKPDAPKTDK